MLRAANSATPGPFRVTFWAILEHISIPALLTVGQYCQILSLGSRLRGLRIVKEVVFFLLFFPIFLFYLFFFDFLKIIFPQLSFLVIRSTIIMNQSALLLLEQKNRSAPIKHFGLQHRPSKYSKSSQYLRFTFTCCHFLLAQYVLLHLIPCVMVVPKSISEGEDS